MNITMKTRRAANARRHAFTLIEMIGVLAVIAILAAVLIPKVFQAINDSRVNNAAVTYNTVKTAISDHYAKFGSLPSENNVVFSVGSAQANAYDRVLLREGFLDKPFDVKIGSITGGISNHVEIVSALAGNVGPDTSNAAYALGGIATTNDATGSVVVQAVIPGCTVNDAKDLNDRLDGAALGAAIGSDDTLGRVKYANSTSNTTVYMYLTHR
jgi:prepilin-type N-terminal cleavage/methylation domain-containing protein